MEAVAEKVDNTLLGRIKERFEENLPAHWKLTTLGEVFKWSSGGTPLRTNEKYYGGDIPWLVIGDLNDGLVTDAANHITLEGLENSAARWVEEGSVLLAMYGSIGKLGIAGRRLTTNQAIAFTNPAPNEAKYLYYFLMYSRHDLASLGKGATQKNISQAVIKAYPFPLAPLPEQRRIVSAIETQLGRLDAAVARLHAAKARLKRYKQAVLKAAYTGEGLKPSAAMKENGIQWLETILKKRRTLAGKSAKYKEPIAPDHEGMPELPEGWAWSSLEQITHPTEVITYGVIKLGDDTPGGVPTIRSSDVKSLRLVLETVKTIDKAIADNYKRTYLEGGEVIFAIRGTIGGVVVVPEECKGYNIEREVARIKLVDERLNQYVAICLAGNYLTAWFGTRLKGIAYTGINIEILRQAPIPIPPPEVLEQIIELTEDRLQRHDDLVATLDAQLVHAGRLRQAVLKRVFQGRLV